MNKPRLTSAAEASVQHSEASGQGEASKASQSKGKLEQSKRQLFSRLDKALRDKALDCFITKLRDSLKRGEAPNRTAIMEEVGHEINSDLDPRQWDNFFLAAYQQSLVQIRSRTVSEHEEAIKREFKLPAVHVVAGSSPKSFYETAARVFVQEIARVSHELKSVHEIRTVGGGAVSDQPTHDYLCIGIVSGSTTGGTLDVVCQSTDWGRDFGFDPGNCPLHFKIFALNSCPTTPVDLDGNATILAWRLAHCLRSQGAQAEPHGLLISGIFPKRELGNIDQKMRDVLRYTEPARVEPPSGISGNPPLGSSPPASQETRLHIILTGAGGFTPDGVRPSIFCRLAAEEGIDLKELHEKKRFVGDLAYSPLSSTGEEIVLTKKIGQHEEECVFYSAASLQVFQAVAADARRSVILVARHEQGKEKARIVHAALWPSRADKEFISCLVVDENTAKSLLWY